MCAMPHLHLLAFALRLPWLLGIAGAKLEVSPLPAQDVLRIRERVRVSLVFCYDCKCSFRC